MKKIRYILLLIISIPAMTSCSSKDSKQNGQITRYPIMFTSINDNTTYKLCNDVEEIKHIGDISTSICKDNEIGILTNKGDGEHMQTNTFTVYVPHNESDFVLIDNKECSIPIYRIDKFENEEYVAVCSSWFVQIYKKII